MWRNGGDRQAALVGAPQLRDNRHQHWFKVGVTITANKAGHSQFIFHFTTCPSCIITVDTFHTCEPTQTKNRCCCLFKFQNKMAWFRYTFSSHAPIFCYSEAQDAHFFFFFHIVISLSCILHRLPAYQRCIEDQLLKEGFNINVSQEIPKAMVYPCRSYNNTSTY